MGYKAGLFGSLKHRDGILTTNNSLEVVFLLF